MRYCGCDRAIRPPRIATSIAHGAAVSWIDDVTALQDQIVGLLCDSDVYEHRKREEIFHALTILGSAARTAALFPENFGFQRRTHRKLFQKFANSFGVRL